MVAISIIAGALIGLLMGALGGGGSILTVPVLVYALDQDPQTATTASLVIVGITAITAAVSHARAGHVQWRTAVLVGVVGAFASIPGTLANRAVNQQVLLLAFAALMIMAATAMLIRSRRPARPSTTSTSHQPPTADGTRPTAEGGPTGTSTVTASRSTAALAVTGKPGSRIARYAKIIAAALVLGFLTGFLGVGGGFLIVPALVLVLGLSMPQAIGTSLVIIAITSLAAFGQRIHQFAAIPWHIVLPFLVVAIIGSLLGKRVTARLSGNTLTKAFAGLLLAVAAYMAIQAALAL
jgi:uncharacterized membrane protein YfcA